MANKVSDRVARLRNKVFGGGGQWLKIPAGASVKLRILPELHGALEWFQEYHSHFGFKVDGKNRAITCMSQLKGENCLADTFHLWLQGHGDDPRYLEIAKRVFARPKYMLNVIDRSDNTIKILQAGPQIMDQIKGIMDNPEYGDIIDPKDGSDITITRTGSGFNTEYKVLAARKDSPIKFDDWEVKGKNLLSLVDLWTPEDMKKAIIEEFGDKLDDLEDFFDSIGDDAPAETTRKKVTKKKVTKKKAAKKGAKRGKSKKS